MKILETEANTTTKEKMSSDINRGSFQNNQYVKYVDFAKAVLWKDRELSLPLEIMDKILMRETPEMVFINKKRWSERWVFKMETVKKVMRKKQVGQEVQYYFPIDIKEGEKILSRKQKNLQEKMKGLIESGQEGLFNDKD